MVNIQSKSFTRMRAMSKATLNAISFDNSGWELTEETLIEQLWVRDEGDTTLMVTLHNRACNPATEQQTLSREMREAGATEIKNGLVSTDSVKVRSGRAAKCISKLPQQDGGYTYQGVLVIPFRNCHITVVIKCMERVPCDAQLCDSKSTHKLIDHPFTRLNQYLKRMERSFNFNPRLLEAPKSQKKSWWRQLSIVPHLVSLCRRVA